MSYVVATIAVDALGVEPLGVKEALVMVVETLGPVQVLQIDVQEPEQLGLDGVAPAKPARRQAAPQGKPAPPQSRQAPARTGSGHPVPLIGRICDSCGKFRESHGQDKDGNFYWGTCARTGKIVYELKERCRAWEGAGQG